MCVARTRVGGDLFRNYPAQNMQWTDLWTPRIYTVHFYLDSFRGMLRFPKRQNQNKQKLNCYSFTVGSCGRRPFRNFIFYAKMSGKSGFFVFHNTFFHNPDGLFEISGKHLTCANHLQLLIHWKLICIPLRAIKAMQIAQIALRLTFHYTV